MWGCLGGMKDILGYIAIHGGTQSYTGLWRVRQGVCRDIHWRMEKWKLYSYLAAWSLGVNFRT